MTRRPRATVIGSGPNGLAAAITLAHGGCEVTILEAAGAVGGGMRSGPLTLPGFTHDICSAVHPLGVASPFFRSLPLEEFGLEWIHPPAPLAHPLDDGTAVILERSVDTTALELGTDVGSYRDLFAPLVRDAERLLEGFLAPLFPPRHPLEMARFGWTGLRSVRALADGSFSGPRARALLGGIAAHSVVPLESRGTAAFALILGTLGHAWGWPIPRGGSQAIADALAGYFTALGGTIVVDRRVTSAHELDDTDLVMFDTDPGQVITIGGDRLPASYRHRLARYRRASAAFKIDWALSGPIPWHASECERAATLHLGGTFEEIAESERAPAAGHHAERPFVLLAQPSLFDDARAPAGMHTAWAYCHVPNGSTVDMTDRIERQIERFAPGFRDRVLGRHVMTPAIIAAHNANNVGGDIVGGSNELGQIIGRPMLRLDPYAIPVKGWYLCSASTPPGGGVHGMSGYNAATSALRSMGKTP